MKMAVKSTVACIVLLCVVFVSIVANVQACSPRTTDAVVVYPPLERIVPSRVMNFSSTSEWNYVTEKAVTKAASTLVSDSAITIAASSRDEAYVFMRNVRLHTLFPRRSFDNAGAFTYTFNFQVRQPVAGAIRGIKVLLFSSLSKNVKVDYRANSDFLQEYDVPWSSTLGGGAWIDRSVSFTVSSRIFEPFIAVRINGTRVTSASYDLRGMWLEDSEREISDDEPLVTKPSTFLDISLPDPELDPNPRTNCPFQRSNLKLWQDASTWPSGEVPTTSTSVINIPPNTAVLINGCSLSSTGNYKRIVVPQGSSLIFSDEDIVLRVRTIAVYGELAIGSSTCRYFSNIDIIFYGSRASFDGAPVEATKGIFVSSEGKIDIHGKQFHHTWTRLAATVMVGDNYVKVQQDVNWEPGQKVVVITSQRVDSAENQNEEMTVKTVHQGRIVQFEERFQFLHYGTEEYQVEVALLSRRIRLMGNPDDSIDDNYGGHVMIMGEGRVAGVEFLYMGQTNMLAKYPLHWHLSNSQPTSFAKDNSVHESFYRCITIHGSHDILVTRNVAYSVTGNCYYLEDGVEENNTLSYNFAGNVRTIFKAAAGGGQSGESFTENSELTVPTDVTAAGFYITNAYNRVIGNAASGGWCGFSFPNLFAPIGNHRDYKGPDGKAFDPAGRPNLEFRGNSAHSAGHFFIFAGCIYIGGNLKYNSQNQLTYNTGRVDRSTYVLEFNGKSWSKTGRTQMFYDTKTFMCNDGISHWGDAVEVDGFESYDNGNAVTLFGSSTFHRGLVVGRSNNPIAPRKARGFQFYDTFSRLIAHNITFRNFLEDDKLNNRVIASMIHSDVFKPQGIAATKMLKFENVPLSLRIDHDQRDTGAARYFNIMDYDGSLSNNDKPMIMGSFPKWWKIDDKCTFNADWNMWVCDKTPQREIASFDVLVPGLIFDTPQSNIQYIGLTCLFGGVLKDEVDRCAPVTRNSGITGHTDNWYFYLYDGSPSDFTVETNQLPPDTSVLFAVRYPPNTKFIISAEQKFFANRNKNLIMASTLEEVQQSDGFKYYFDNDKGFLYIKMDQKAVVNRNPWYERHNVKLYGIYNGPYYRIRADCQTNSLGLCPVEFKLPLTDVAPKPEDIAPPEYSGDGPFESLIDIDLPDADDGEQHDSVSNSQNSQPGENSGATKNVVYMWFAIFVALLQVL